MFSEAFFQEVFGYNIRLGETIDTVVYLEIGPAISDEGKEIIFIKKFLRGV